MKAIHRYQEGHGPEAGVCLERRLAVLCQKKHQPDFFGISPGQKLTISWFPSGLHTLYSTQHILQVRDKNLENACAKASPQSLLQSTSGKERHHFGFTAETTFVSWLSTFNLAQDTAFLLFKEDPKPCISLYFNNALLAGRRCQQIASTRRGPSPSKSRRHTSFPANPHSSSTWAADHPIHFKSPRKDKIGCAR